MKRKIILIGFVGIFLALFAWVLTHGFIEVTANQASGDVLYSVMDQSSGREQLTESKSKTIKKLVRRGSHEISVTTSEGTYFAIKKTGGFLSNTRVAAKPRAENERSFIGNNPSACVHIVEERLLSHACDGNFNKLKIHTPATTVSTTAIATPKTPVSGTIEGTINSNGKSLVLIRSSVTEGYNEAHFIYGILPDGSLINKTRLNDLSKSKFYKISAQGQGFVVFAADGSEALKYESPTTKPKLLQIPEPKTKSLLFANLLVGQDRIMAVYTDNPDREVSNISDTEGLKAHSEEDDEAAGMDKDALTQIVVMNSKGSGEKYLDFNAPANDLGLCGKNLLCTLDNGKLSVHDIDGEKPKLLYIVSGVSTVQYKNNELLIVRKSGILVFNTTTRDGYTGYSIGDYTICGLQGDALGYVVCVADDHLGRATLRMKNDTTNNSLIDEKISQLVKSSDVKSLSIYGKFIHITPDTGEPEISATTGYYEYNRQKIEAAKAQINKQIDQLNIRRSEYTIVYTLN